MCHAPPTTRDPKTPSAMYPGMIAISTPGYAGVLEYLSTLPEVIQGLNNIRSMSFESRTRLLLYVNAPNMDLNSNMDSDATVIGLYGPPV